MSHFEIILNCSTTAIAGSIPAMSLFIAQECIQPWLILVRETPVSGDLLDLPETLRNSAMNEAAARFIEGQFAASKITLLLWETSSGNCISTSSADPLTNLAGLRRFGPMIIRPRALPILSASWFEIIPLEVFESGCRRSE